APLYIEKKWVLTMDLMPLTIWDH
ncbi:hypothetical protein AVEN_229264-1, partial [Araneus ventricosus]